VAPASACLCVYQMMGRLDRTVLSIYGCGNIKTCAPRIFPWGGGGGADPEAVYNLFDFKNNVIKIML
jgi:hypothetical protein